MIAPHFHESRVKYDDKGIPVEVSRKLSPFEADWDFWTSSDAFKTWKPSSTFFTYVPHGETFVYTDGTVLNAGWHLTSPFKKIQSIKSSYPITLGVINRNTSTKDTPLDVYIVAHAQVVDPSKSALYKDPETLAIDSERAFSKAIRRTIINSLENVSAKDGKLSEADSKKLIEKIEDTLVKTENEFGIKVLGLELRGAFPLEYNLSAKLRSVEAPLRKPDQTGLGLKANYWADILEPSYFFKYSFGSEKIHRTPYSEHLDFVVPSPPDYHHFNQVPRLCVEPETK